jgi:hypothetical protein
MRAVASNTSSIFQTSAVTCAAYIMLNRVAMQALSCETWYTGGVGWGGPPLWASGQSSCHHIQRSGLDSRRYHIFWEVVGLEQGTLSLASTIEELLERNRSFSGLERREYSRRDLSRWLCETPYPKNLILTSPTSGGRSDGKVSSRIEATEFYWSGGAVEIFCKISQDTSVNGALWLV